MAGHWLIAGANRGIGFELAHQLVRRGDQVTASVRTGDRRAALAPFHIPTLVFDTRDADAVHDAAMQVHAPIDVLVVNAGAYGPQHQSPLDLDFDGTLDLFSTNTLGPLRVAQAFLPLLRRAERPRIVFISSIMGSMALEGSKSIAYRASKAALNKIMQGLAYDLKPEGVTVVSIHPGWVRTDMGGANAPLSASESAASIIEVIDGLSLEEAGCFIDYQNRRLDW